MYVFVAAQRFSRLYVEVHGIELFKNTIASEKRGKNAPVKFHLVFILIGWKRHICDLIDSLQDFARVSWTTVTQREIYNDFARALFILVHYSAILCKTTNFPAVFDERLISRLFLPSGEARGKRGCASSAVKATQRTRRDAMGKTATRSHWRNNSRQCFWLGCKGSCKVRVRHLSF